VNDYDGRVTPLLEVRNLSVDLPSTRGWIRPVRSVSFDLEDGSCLGIVGESGSGKTMLALALMGLEPPGARKSGEAWLRLRGTANEAKESRRASIVAAAAGEMRAIRGREVSMVFQEPMTALNPTMRAGAQIEEAIRVHEPRMSAAAVRSRALDALRRCAVPEPETRAAQYPHQLSGGLRQRVLLAMAIAAGPRLLIADEATTALDVTIQKQILALLLRLRAEMGLAVLFITHDLGIVAQVADRIAVMYAGSVVEEGPAAGVLRTPRHPYTQALMRAAPSLQRRTLQPIPGSVPRLDELPRGCAFAPRCEYRREECDVALPDPHRASGDHTARCILLP
jgi:oligopeptide/dipeptide ABC transporter ATP-binding protein